MTGKGPIRGFSLVELVVGMVLLGFACAGCLSLLISQKAAWRDPIVQQMSRQILNKVAGEIRIRNFDEKSDQGRGVIRCGETLEGLAVIACSSSLGPDGGSETGTEQFNDVDDFITSVHCARDATLGCRDDYVPAAFFYEHFVSGGSSDETDLQEALNQYYVRVRVTPCPVGSLASSGVTLSCSGADDHSGKRIDISILLRDGETVDYSFVRTNI